MVAQKKYHEDEGDKLSKFLGNPLAKAFPLLGSGSPLQLLPAAAGPGFPLRSLLRNPI